jgi:hypothetical protein
LRLNDGDYGFLPRSFERTGGVVVLGGRFDLICSDRQTAIHHGGGSGALSTRLYFLRLLELAYVAISMPCNLLATWLDTSHIFVAVSQSTHQRGNREHVTIAAFSYLIARISRRRLSGRQSGQGELLASCHVSSVTWRAAVRDQAAPDS